MKYEIAIAVKDEPILPPYVKRKMEGDIIAVRPYPWNWGRKEIDMLFVVMVETSRPPEVMRKLEEGIFQMKKTFQLISERKAEEIEAQSEIHPDMIFRKVEKRRFRIPLSLLRERVPGLSLLFLQNKKKIYQPMKRATWLIRKFNGKDNNRLLRLDEVDCATHIIPAEKEHFIDIDTHKVIYDKLRGEFV